MKWWADTKKGFIIKSNGDPLILCYLLKYAILENALAGNYPPEYATGQIQYVKTRFKIYSL